MNEIGDEIREYKRDWRRDSREKTSFACEDGEVENEEESPSRRRRERAIDGEGGSNHKAPR